MKARICDRCGEFYENNIKDEYKITKISPTASRYSKLVDLCPKCQKSLASWFESVKKK